MWTKEIVPSIKNSIQKELLAASNTSDTNVESEIVFCDIGSGVGNICLQVLAETNCKKTVGVEIIPSRHKAAQTAFANAQKMFPSIYRGKNALWVEKDLVQCASTLKKEGVNVLFSHSWMFDDDLMRQFTKVITEVPSIACVITSRKLDNHLLQSTPLKLHSLAHFSADWNDKAPFYVYTRSSS
ncbi:histone-lysine N-methyltransferase, H3 lysine-79 specific [Strigomonas culicis]|nr:histone-lysine N-methyltransferase, H3 lysine-79 specific [Strigomonas culicis]EPY37285.1 histone-lysine N-methyltransferase, H3 lysine-79 specific [Strigomonas culicis]|eukprot:EPY27069.1 histone-lysine N-methyltransferase, H3 lysine-79 specific [Strigomonas culicis]